MWRVLKIDKVKIGIVGLGPRGFNWINVIERVQGAKLKAICEKMDPRLEKGRERVEGLEVRSYQDFGEMLRQANLDAVAIVAEPYNNGELVCKALEAGKHVICEVPLAYSLEDCWKIVLAVENNDAKFAMAEQLRYSPYIRAWKKKIEEGDLGKIIFAEGQYFHGLEPERWYWIDKTTGEHLGWDEAKNNPKAKKTRQWRQKHPIFYLPHELSPILKAMNDRVRSVVGMGTDKNNNYYKEENFTRPDFEAALMHTEKDAVLRMATAFNAPTPRPLHWHHIMGTHGAVETNRSSSKNPVVGPGKVWMADKFMDTKTDIDWTFTPYNNLPSQAQGLGHGNLDYFPVEDFILSIRNGTEPELGIYKAAQTAAPAILAGKSIEQGNVILEVPDFYPNEERQLGEKPSNINV